MSVLRESVGQRLALRMARLLVHRASAVLPAGHTDWGNAIAAELEAIDGTPARLGFAASGIIAIASVALHDAVRGRIVDRSAVLVAAAIGLVASATDLAAGSRAPAVAMIAASSFTLAAVVGRAAWRWPVLIGGMLPLLIAITGNRGPYEHDRADQWYAMALTISATFVGVMTRRAVLAIRRARLDAASRR